MVVGDITRFPLEVSVHPAVLLENVVKRFGTTRAIDDLSLTIPTGMMCGVIGPSGAGKTTAIRMIMSILFPDAGRLTVLGRDSARDAKDRIGYLPEERGVYRKMRVGAFLAYVGQLKGLSAAEASARASRLLQRLDLADTEMRKCEDMSKGMLQRIQFVAAIVNQPDLLILDEPFSGLDPVSVRLLKDLIAEEHRRGATILFSTHVMAHAEELCDHVVMIYKGRKVLDEPMAGLRRQHDTSTIRFEPLDPSADLSRLQGLPGIARVVPTADGCDIRLLEGSDPVAAIRSVAAVIAPARIELARIRLEDVFIRIVSEDRISGDAEQALRANLQGLSREGAAL
jgi:ABC-2 type transport system ATP-binding protein